MSPFAPSKHNVALKVVLFWTRLLIRCNWNCWFTNGRVVWNFTLSKFGLKHTWGHLQDHQIAQHDFFEPFASKAKTEWTRHDFWIGEQQYKISDNDCPASDLSVWYRLELSPYGTIYDSQFICSENIQWHTGNCVPCEDGAVGGL